MGFPKETIILCAENAITTSRSFVLQSYSSWKTGTTQDAFKSFARKTFIIPIYTDSHDNLLSDLSFLCFYRLCETHSVTIYGGENAIDHPVVNSLCGFRDRESINYSGGNKLLVEFR